MLAAGLSDIYKYLRMQQIPSYSYKYLGVVGIKIFPRNLIHVV